MLRSLVLSSLALFTALAADHPILPIGSPAPEFTLPGIDGKTHSLSEYAASPVLAIVFTCNHCPIAQMYERRIARLAADYRQRGVAVVAIQPNAPEATRVDELDCSDVGDSLEEMKIRAHYKHLDYPYLYDGATQQTARAYGPQATPHVFVFDRERRLRYEGRFDNSYRMELVKSQDARDAVEALLSGREVAVPHTGVFGCSTKWKEKEAGRIEALHKIESQPVTLEASSEEGLKQAHANTGERVMLLYIWSSSCSACVEELAGIETTYRMYKLRGFDLVTVAVDPPDQREAVLRVLKEQHVTGRNLLPDSNELSRTGSAYDPALPETVLLGPGGQLLYQHQGRLDILELRRTILANLPAEYDGFRHYWTTER